MIRNMTEPAESTTESTAVTEQPRYYDGYDRPSRLSQVAAVVGIVAGVVFTVAVIFFSGFFLGWSSGGYGGGDGCSADQMGPGGMTGTCPMMGTGGTMGPG